MAIVPLLLFLNVIRSAASFSDHFWALPSIRQLLLYFNSYADTSSLTALFLGMIGVGIYTLGVRNAALTGASRGSSLSTTRVSTPPLVFGA